jgi:hypothetical protein
VSNFSASNPNFVVTTANGGAVGTATVSDVTATVATVGVASSRLSGTYTYTGSVTGSIAYTDAALQSQGGASLASGTWTGISITGTVTGATSSGTGDIKHAFVSNGSSYTGYGLTSAVSGGKGSPLTPTVAQIIASNNASGDTTVNMNFSLNGGHPVSPNQASDTLTLSGINTRLGGGTGPDGGSILTDTFVLQMSYVNNANNTGYYIGWWDPAFNSNVGGWVNAIAGNSNANLGTDYVGSGAYLGSYASYTSAGHPGNGLTLDQQLGAYGYDTSTNTAWAVLDHNSDFEVIPEPSTYAMIFSGFGMLCVWHRSRRRKTNKVQ